jgi:hypothetical protein
MLALNDSLGCLIPAGESRLEPRHFDHQTQQRGDHFFARENQHIAQRSPTVEESSLPGNLRTSCVTSMSGGRLRYCWEQMSTLPACEEGPENYLLQSHVSQLSESTIRDLQAALAEQLKGPDGPTQELTKLLRQVGVEAREKNINPEELIVVFKQMWNSLAESVRPQNAEVHERMRQTLVTLCIKAYYAE